MHRPSCFSCAYGGDSCQFGGDFSLFRMVEHVLQVTSGYDKRLAGIFRCSEWWNMCYRLHQITINGWRGFFVVQNGGTCATGYIRLR